MLLKSKSMLLVLVISLLFLTGCGGSSSTSSDSSLSNTKVLSKAEFDQLYSDSIKFQGRRVDFFARIFVEPVKDNKGTYIKAYADDDHSKVTIIGINDPQLGVKNGDIINVTGVVGKFEGEKSFVKELKAPSIIASEIEKSDYSPAFAPAIKTSLVNKEINQNGYILKLNKVEFAEKETRVFININNSTKDKIKFDNLNANITQGNNQIKKLSNPNEKVAEINSYILPGEVQNGVLIFDPVQVNGEKLIIMFKGDSDNMNVHFTTFIFDIVLKK